jgi:hypothetical protein
LVKIFEFYLVTQSLFKVKEEPEDDWDQVAEAEIREANRYSPNIMFQINETNSADKSSVGDP